ncbi:ATP-dependent endonuclease [Paenibacillus sp. p3-SID867]|uniref:ATP-dependent nuclease n=1 Tax=Paenibacillus sp. p3-SID867 TaxID=2916363 RepID=UPI0021A34B12|nr:AAA family ATPase [Paenibacillus sp. p3-SID867]
MYLSRMIIENFRGIQTMDLSFNPDINIIIGENGSSKSTIIDAIRLLYNLGEPIKELFVKNEDFATNLQTGDSASTIKITYEFRGLTDIQKGALYEYIVLDPNEDFASITISYEKRRDKHPKFEYFTGANPGQRASSSTFEIFQHYYLGALRDSTSDLLSAKKNILGRVIKRSVEANQTEEEYKAILEQANTNLLQKVEVGSTKTNINNNLAQIYSTISQIDLHIEQSKIDYIVNVIKPYLPFSNPNVGNSGLSLYQNSLGYNNLIYIATVLSDMSDRVNRDNTIHYALLIEEPEAHLHPQLQLNLYNFLKQQICSDSCQLFITTHSPTLTSKSDLDKLFIVDGNKTVSIGQIFNDREQENLSQNNKVLRNADFLTRRKMLERYLDVTKSQLFYAKSLILVEGISEELLLSAFAELENFKFEEKDIELVQTGTSFYPFLLLFNSTNEAKRINKKVAVLTDDDRYTESKHSEYSFENLLLDNYRKLNELRENISRSSISSRIGNLNSFKNHQDTIGIFAGYKTFEFEIAFSNVAARKSEVFINTLFKYLVDIENEKLGSIRTYLDQCSSELNEIERMNVALLTWKCLPSKSEFAQDFAHYLITNKTDVMQHFTIPSYIKNAFAHLR